MNGTKTENMKSNTASPITKRDPGWSVFLMNDFITNALPITPDIHIKPLKISRNISSQLKGPRKETW